jgi:hypothetical protein
MSFRDRLIEGAQEALGVAVVPRERLDQLEESATQYQDLRTEAEDLAFHTLQYWTGRPQELRPERRQRLAQKSRVAWMQDPIAGTEAEHYANFALSRGVSKPRAKDDRVQAIIDRAWTDANNAEKLTSLDALRAISNELRAGANVFPVAYPGGGRVRIGFLEADTVQDVVTHDEDRLRPLWYKTHTVKRHWSYATHSIEVKVATELDVSYYSHWRNVEDCKREAKRVGSGMKAPEDPPKELIQPGLVYHVRTNRLLEQLFGTPHWARSLRFFSALNRLMEARVSMAQAASSIIAKRVVKGGQSDVMKMAQNVLQQTGEIGAASSVRAAEGFKPPVRPASTMLENESHTLQAFQMSSGAAQGAQDIQTVRGAATAPSAMGQHYFGDASNSNLASSVALELPAMMAVGAWQEVLEQLLRWFTDMAIQEAVRAGELGGNVKTNDDALVDVPLTELCLSEAADKAVAEKRTGVDLSYSFEMPYPGRRNLGEVTTTFTSVMTQLSPIGENEILTEQMLSFLFTHGLQLENATDLAQEVTKRQSALLKSQASDQAKQQQAQLDAQAQAAAAAPAPNPNQPGTPNPANGETGSVYGEARKTAQPSGDMATTKETEYLPVNLDADADLLIGEILQMFNAGVLDPAVTAAGVLDVNA